MLGDWDVEDVTRQIILAKKPSALPELEQVWRASSGEISRHLRGTKRTSPVFGMLTSDYPLLPVRRRLERVFAPSTPDRFHLRSFSRVVR